jgi:hypothetical protein
MTIEKNNVSGRNTSRFLGAAFLIQAVGSIISYFLLRDPLIAPVSITEKMNLIANNAMQMQASIVVEMITAMGIVMLGALMFITLKKQNMKISLTALGLYVMEAGLLAVSSLAAFSLLKISQESILAGHPEYLQSLGNLFFKTMAYGNTLHMLPFALGATMFYSLFFTSRMIPRVLAIVGLIAAPLALAGTLFAVLGFEVPLAVYIPNGPFELTMGVWLLVRGTKNTGIPQ